MFKNFLPLLLILCMSLPSQAQFLGIRAGYNSTDANIDFKDAEVSTGSEGSLVLGIFADLPVGFDAFSIQPEINYLNRSYSIDGDLTDFSQEYDVAYIDLGALAKFNIARREGLGFYIGAGPYISYALSGDKVENGDETEIDFDADRLNRTEFQFAGVAGLTFDVGVKLFLEGRYMGSFSNQSDIEDADIKQKAIGVHGGIMIPLGDQK